MLRLLPLPLSLSHFPLTLSLSLYRKLARHLHPTTVKTTWQDEETEPTESTHSSTNSHAVVNGHAHAQVMPIVSTLLKALFFSHFSRFFLSFFCCFNVLVSMQASSLLDESQSVDEDGEIEQDTMLSSETRRSLHKYTI